MWAEFEFCLFLNLSYKKIRLSLGTLKGLSECLLFQAVVLFGDQLCTDGHYAADKVHKKARNIEERREANREKAAAVFAKLKDALALQQFLSDCEELREWIEEKMIRAQDETYRYVKLYVLLISRGILKKY